jgi:tRNA (cmo5U34)-methyltransferase
MARCVEAYPGARAIGVDEDPAMLAAAQARLGGRLQTRHGSFETLELPSADAIVACLALHHVPPGVRRRRLLRRLRQALRPGGVLVNADCFPASNRAVAAADRAAWVSHLERAYTPAEVRGFFRRWATEDYYVPLGDELAALRRAGFRTDVAYRRHDFAVIVGS